MSKYSLILELSGTVVQGLAFRAGASGRVIEKIAREYVPLTKENVSAFVQNHFPETATVYFNLPYRGSFLRELEFPFLEKKKVQEILPLELSSLVSYDPEEIVYDTHLYPDLENSVSHVVVHGASSEEILPWLSLFSELGIPVGGIYSPPDMFVNLIQYLPGEKALYCFLTRDRTFLILMDHHRWQFSRVVPLGYFRLLEKLKDLFRDKNVSIEQILLSLPPLDEEAMAAWLKRNYSMSDAKVKQWRKEFQEFALSLEKEISLSLKNSEEDPTSLKIYAATDLFSFEHLRTLFAEGLNGVEHFPVEKTPLVKNERSDFFLASAMTQVTSRRAMQFLKGKLRKLTVKKKSSFPLSVIIPTAVALILFIFSFLLDLSASARERKARKNEISQIYKQYFPGTGDGGNDPVAAAKKQLLLQQKKTEIYRKFFSLPRFSETIVELNSKLSSIPGLAVESFAYSENKYSVKVIVANFEEVNSLKSSLKESTVFKKVETSGERTMPTDSGKRVRFNLELVLEDK